jgi:hypothetical protein
MRPGYTVGSSLGGHPKPAIRGHRKPALKQNLEVKSFVGTSDNALRIQIWTALIAILLLKWLQHLSKAKWSLSKLASMLRLNLFTYRALTAWLDNPFGTPPILSAP